VVFQAAVWVCTLGKLTVVLSSLVERSVVGGELMLHFPVLWSFLIYFNPKNYLIF
jgi:hypothetical protein